MKSLLVYFTIVVAVVIADNCIVYKEGDELPPSPIGGRECFEVWGDSNRYCINFDCPTPECSDPITPENGCPYCNGTCIAGGQVYKWGEHFTCPDRCNGCSCEQFGGTYTLMYCYLSQPPEECQ